MRPWKTIEWLMDADPDALLFTDNETNLESCFGVPNYSPT